MGDNKNHRHPVLKTVSSVLCDCLELTITNSYKASQPFSHCLNALLVVLSVRYLCGNRFKKTRNALKLPLENIVSRGDTIEQRTR
jgi:hypothetical protein